ncbi:MAG: aminoacyl-tRNA hydrolase [Actinobacteria bacterium]|nr:aminoacyl-tRNA hydrolase [Actinomycetota bacterium]PLS82226.1 MAG: aminoacyl-tRNA hydrolase [Actinomycetota bacterium]
MKQVVVVDGSLGLPRGKLAAQVAHAAVASFLEAGEEAKELWLADGMPKVVLESPDAAYLRRLETAAEERGIPARSVTDAGKTVIPAETTTCLGLGPAPEEALDELTGELKLLR